MATCSPCAPRSLETVLTAGQMAEFRRRGPGFPRLAYLVEIHAAPNFRAAGVLLNAHKRAGTLRRDACAEAARAAAARRFID